MGDAAIYLLMFGVAFGAASLLPFYSEPLLVGLALAGDQPLVALWLAASLGNTAGAVLNWGIGRSLNLWRGRRWFPFRERDLERGERFFNRWGAASLLLAWAPVGGDALTVIAGLLRVRLWLFVLLAGSGKAARYGVVLWGAVASTG